MAGVAITNNGDNAGYYAVVDISSSLPQGKIPYAVMWENERMQGGVCMVLTPKEIILCSPVAITLASTADRKARVYYR